MAPFVDFRVDLDRRGAPWMLRDDDFSTSFVQLFNDSVGIKGLVRDQPVEFDVLDQGCDATVSKRWPGSRTKRTRLPKASVSARILVVIPPLDLPIA